MGAFLQDQLNRTILALFDGAFQMPLSSFQDFAFEQIGKLVPWDSGVWATGIHTTNQIHAVHFCNQPPDLMARYNMNYVATDLVRSRAIAEPGRTFRIEDVMHIDAYRALPVYTDLGQYVGIEYAMGTAQNDPASGLSELILLWRADRQRPFTDDERLIAQTLVPHMIGAWRHRQLIAVASIANGIQETDYSAGRALAIIDEDGMIYAVIGDFGLKLAEAVPGWVGPELPPVILSAMQSGKNVITINGYDIAFSKAENRRLIGITLHKNTGGLTDAEMKVAELFAGGSTSKQIAATTGLSNYTVRNQLSSAYRKLGVHSKLGLFEAIKHRA
jgi:DNA-binding CsgD family transcriptional regulator